ncbi:hypothetical protein PABG_12162 [Paracoccidioides brasiliensis Pb03]|nr:hypothetical protein PABG_12162 [Paracoccidioides brasiliensis Pb03]
MESLVESLLQQLVTTGAGCGIRKPVNMAHLLGSSFVSSLIQTEMTAYVIRGPNSDAILEKGRRWNPSPISPNAKNGEKGLVISGNILSDRNGIGLKLSAASFNSEE